MSILIKNGQIVTESACTSADLYISGEIIQAIGTGLPNHADNVIDADGKYVIPGGVDVHTHLDAPVAGTVSSDDFESGTRAAAFGGTTCIIDFATQSRGRTLHTAYELWRQKARPSVLDYGLHMIVVDISGNQLGEIREIIEEGVTSFKLFTAYPGTLMVDEETISQILKRAGERGALVAIHAEHSEMIEPLIKAAIEQRRGAPIEHARTRPAAAEAEAIRRVIMLAETAGMPLYIVHVSSAAGLSELCKAQQRKVRVFGETCPQYLLLSDQELERPDFEGAKFVLTPPLRKQADQDALWKGLADDHLRVVSTDHCPFFFRTQKQAGLHDFTKIPNGGPGIENRLQLLYHFGVNAGKLSINRWVDLVATNPAKLFGLYPRKGTLNVGSDADVVIWNPNAEHTISAATHHMRVDYSMYEGMKVSGNAETVITRGEIIVDRDKWLGKTGRGEYLKRECFAGAWQS